MSALMPGLKLLLLLDEKYFSEVENVASYYLVPVSPSRVDVGS